MITHTLAVRLTLREGYTELTQKIQTDVFTPGELQNIFAIKHQGKHQDNPHFHFAVVSTLSTQTLRARLKKYYNCKGNETLSIKKWDGQDKYIQYCLHECKTIDEVNRDILFNTFPDITQDKLKLLLQNHQVIATVIKEGAPRKVMMELFEKLDLTRGYTDGNLFSIIMKYYIEKGDWLPNKYQAERYLNYLKVMIAQHTDLAKGNTQSIDNFIDRLYEKYFLGY